MPWGADALQTQQDGCVEHCALTCGPGVWHLGGITGARPPCRNASLPLISTATLPLCLRHRCFTGHWHHLTVFCPALPPMNGTRTTQHEAGSRPDASEQPDASAHASAEAFLQGTTVAWSYLQPAERKAIRACCSAGRLQHDRMLAELRLGSSSCSLPSPGEVRGSLQAVVGRGARLQALVARFRSGDVGLREAQL